MRLLLGPALSWRQMLSSALQRGEGGTGGRSRRESGKEVPWSVQGTPKHPEHLPGSGGGRAS